MNSFFKLHPLSFILLSIFIISCSNEKNEVLLDDELTVLNSQNSSFSPVCFNFQDYEFEVLGLIRGYDHNNKVYLEYSLEPVGLIPLTIGEDYKDNDIYASYRLIEEVSAFGDVKKILMIVMSKNEEDILSEYTLTTVPITFSGHIAFYNEKSDFLEFRIFENGNLEDRYTFVQETTCENDLQFRNDHEGCFEVFNHQFVTITVESTYWGATGSESNPIQYKHIISREHSQYTELVLSRSWLCPEDDYVFIPFGDEVPEIGMRAECIGVANNFIQSEGTDPCRPEMNATQLVIEALGGENINDLLSCKNADDLAAALNSLDIIKVLDHSPECDKSMSEDCPRLKSALDKLIGPDPSNPVCDLLSTIGETSGTTYYSWDCNNEKIRPRPDETYPLGQHQPSNEAIRLSRNPVYFSKDICDQSCEQIISVILHESLHAEFYTMIYDHDLVQEAFDGQINDVFEANTIWQRIAQDEFDSTNNKHEVMAEYYANEFANAMRDYFGVGTTEDYLYWAYKGLRLPAGSWPQPEATMENNWNTFSNNLDLDLNCN